MPKIKLRNGGYYRYKTIPIYLGVKQINKEIALENLSVLKDVLERRNIGYQLTFGTLLGAIRDNDFITHDEDIDLLLMEEDKLAVFDALAELKDLCFDVARYDRRGLLSIYRKGEYIDFYFYTNRGDGSLYCSGSILPSEVVEKTMYYNFKGLNVKIPVEYKKFLLCVYGENWRTPAVWTNYEIPRLKRVLLSTMSVAKEWLPDWIYFLLVRSSERRGACMCEARLKRYRGEYGN